MSGLGRELGEYGLHAYTEVKTVRIEKCLINPKVLNCAFQVTMKVPQKNS